MQQNVLGLEVTMNDVVAVCVIERTGHARCNAHCFFHRKLPLPIESRSKALAFDERHDIEKQAVRLAAVEQRQQVRMLQICCYLDLGEKALASQHRAQLRL